MEALTQAWLDANLLTQLTTIAISVYLIIKGIIVVPFIKIGNKPKSDCRSCTSVDDNLAIYRIKTQETINEQMNSVRSYFTEITLKMEAIYLRIASNEKDIEHYILLVQSLKNELLELMSTWCKENHFTSKDPLEYQNYSVTKTNIMIETVVITLNRKYKDFQVSRQEVAAVHAEELVEFAREKFMDTFNAVRKIAAEKEAEVAAIQDRIDAKRIK